ncbi:uncharacterized protein TM35_000321160 [Trypanosoma theileri]|uniref:Uncharacterized protein n=1 Tax=Trypanosoma theileri TaxID=67003 RepID=A0A1X0NMJ5_9TRYP|nr:uncharacterized protein TM35_000321160 [Trypanosoma theileri]ORC85801.1 hypothetical protein TM35_000321160 [Trypanosoma theileri]
MSNFSREATKLLHVAEDALSGRRNAASLQQAIAAEAPWESFRPAAERYKNNDIEYGLPGNHHVVVELQRQLHVAMSEINNLRCELMAERESRSQTLTSLGRRWKEEVMVELRAADHQSRRAISEMEANMLQRLKEEATTRTVMQRQLEEVLRSSKVRDRSQFDHQEHIQEQLDGLRERLEAAVAECGIVRVESAQQLEKERASLSQRLDAELLRYVDMRRDDQREREALRQQLKTDIVNFGSQVRELVDEAWRTHGSTLERTLREPLDAFSRQMGRHEEIVSAMDAKIHDCTATCRAELRLQTASLQERVAAVEATAAVTASRVDRAERKADAAHDTAGRTNANVDVARDVAERAAAQAQRATERAQRMEDTVQDRYARLQQLEGQLASIATAEKLRSEIEAVRRAALRAESGVDALRQVCERDEQLVEQTRRAVDGYSDRISGCEQLTHRLRAAVETVEGRMPPLLQRLTALEEAREGAAVGTAHVDDTLLLLQQRVQVLEGGVRSVGERLEQWRRDVNNNAQTLAARVESVSELTLRSETNSAAARADVDRMDRRVTQLESQTSQMAADCHSLRGAVDDHAKDTATLSSRLQQVGDWQEQREARFETLLSETGMQNVTAVEQSVNRLDAKLQRDVRRLETNLRERTAALESLVEEKISTLQERLGRSQTPQSETMLQALARDMEIYQSKVESLNKSLTMMDDSMEQTRREYVLMHDWNMLRKTVSALESKLRSVQEDTALQQQTDDEVQIKLRDVEGEQRRQRHLLQQLQENLMMVRTEVRDFASPILTKQFSRIKAEEEFIPTRVKVVTEKEALAPTTTRTTTTTPVPAVQATSVSDTGTTVERFSGGSVMAHSVEYHEVRSSNTAAIETQGSEAGTTKTTTTTSKTTSNTHPRTSSTEVMLLGDRNESPDAHVIPQSLEDSRGVEEQPESSTTTPITRRTMGSHRVDSLSQDEVSGRRLVSAWGGMRSSDSIVTPNAREPERTAEDTTTSSKKNSSPDDETHGENVKANEDRALVGLHASLMNPPQESSSSTASAEKLPTRRGIPTMWRQTGSSYDTASEETITAVTPLAVQKKSTTSESPATPVKDTEVSKVPEEETQPAKKTTAWYDDWDDTSESEEGNVPSEQDKTKQEEEKRKEGEVEVRDANVMRTPGGGSDIYATPRKMFVTAASTFQEEEVEIPRHGTGTSTGSSSGESEMRKTQQAPMKRFTSFDDSTSEEEN